MMKGLYIYCIFFLILFSSNTHAGNLSTLVGSSSSGSKSPKFQIFLTSGTFTPSAALLAAGGRVELELRGGGGGGISGGPYGGGGGGGSSMLKTYVVVSGATTVTIGAGGASGTNGSASAFGATTVAGGLTPPNLGWAKMHGGGGSGNYGMAGGVATVDVGTGSPSYGGAGGTGGGFGGGSGGGGGGGGGYTGATASSGGTGGSGYCLVTWWE